MSRPIEVQIQQVILNLIVNACDAMESVAADQRRLWISTSMHPHLGVELAVRDSGRASTSRCWSGCSILSSAPSPRAWDWAYRSRRRSWSLTAGGCGRSAVPAGGAIFRLTRAGGLCAVADRKNIHFSGLRARARPAAKSSEGHVENAKAGSDLPMENIRTGRSRGYAP